MDRAGLVVGELYKPLDAQAIEPHQAHDRLARLDPFAGAKEDFDNLSGERRKNLPLPYFGGRETRFGVEAAGFYSLESALKLGDADLNPCLLHSEA